MRLQDRIVRGLMLQGGGNVLGLLGGVARSVAVARLVPAADIGVYALALVAVGLAVRLGGLGIGAALYHHDGIGSGVYRRCIALATLGGLLCGAIGGGLVAPAAVQLPTPTGAVGVVALASLLALAAGGQACAEVCGAHLSLRLAYARLAATGAVARVLGDAAAIAIVIIRPDVGGLVLGLGLQGVLLGGLYLSADYHATELRTGGGASGSSGPVGIGRVVRLGLLNVVDGFINFGVSRLDRLIVSGVFGLGVLGYYEVVATLAAKPLEIVIATVRGIYAPLITRFVRRPGGLRLVHHDYMVTVGLLILPVIGVAVCFGESLLALLYGTTYASYYEVYAGLSVLAFTKSVGLPVWQYIVAAGRMRLSIVANVWIGFLRVAVLYGACLVLPLGQAVGVYVLVRAATSWGFEHGVRVRAFRLRFLPALRPLGTALLRTTLACLLGYGVWLGSGAAALTQPALMAIPVSLVAYAFLSRRDLLRGYLALGRKRTVALPR